MNHLVFGENPNNEYDTAVLIKDRYFKNADIVKHYINPLKKEGIDPASIIAFDLYYPNNKVTASQGKKYIGQLLPTFVKMGITTIFVADATYFKILTGKKKAEENTGYIVPCSIKDYTHINVCYGLNYGVLMHNPNQVHKLDLAIQTLVSHLNGTYVTMGQDTLIDPIYYQKSELENIQIALDKLHAHPMITCDTETFGLDLTDGGIGTIAFSWNKHNGIAIHIKDDPKENTTIFGMLKRFFERYNGTVMYHNATFDIKHIIFNCFMKDPLDRIGLLHGLHTMCKKIHDTKIITYLATNTAAGNELGLKVLSHPYLGNYGVDVTDITKIPTKDLLTYNLKDCIGTYYVFEQYYPIMLKDEQQYIYETIMLPSIKLIVQMELTGMPIDMDQVLKTKEELSSLRDTYLTALESQPMYDAAANIMRHRMLADINSKLKVKQHTFAKVENEPFNPNSGNQLQILIYDVMELPVIDKTPKGAPSTGAKTLDKLIAHTYDERKVSILTNLIGLNKVEKILSTFIPAFEKAFCKTDSHYLHGNFNLGGTLSGRLSSSNPNLQNLPSGSIYGKAVKKCFRAPKGWLFVGADFSSLEDRINALLTKDKNKLKVYTDGYDGHALRAHSYWADKMPDIKQAEPAVKCYEANGTRFTEHDTIIYDGIEYTGKEFFTTFFPTTQQLGNSNDSIFD